MESLKELYRIGKGPSSSHTMGPYRAAQAFAAANPHAEMFEVYLYGSLAKTGQGHLTDKAVEEGFTGKKVKIYFDNQKTALPHPNTMELIAYQGGEETSRWRVISVGGGKIEIEGQSDAVAQDVYHLNTFTEIRRYCEERHLQLWQYAEEEEGPELWPFLHKVWNQMKNTVYEGLDTEGELPGSLHVHRKAKYLYTQRHMDESANTKYNRIVCSYAFAASEQNACGGIVVTAPTCGSCGVMPAVLLYSQNKMGFSDLDIAHALATGGIMGNLIKTNASISGAECGCQAEIGSACSMASAALAQLYEMDLDQIEYAAELAMEHHLGLTCDPIDGLVQIPCIERNAVAAMRALDSLSLANFLTNTRKISFDMVVRTMYETGKDLFSKYKETSEGGLAKSYRDRS